MAGPEYPDPALFDRAPLHSCPYCRDARIQGLMGCIRHTAATEIAIVPRTQVQVNDLLDVKARLSHDL